MPHDPKNYRIMSEPFQDNTAANAAIDAFAADLKAIRDKHRIADVYCIIAVNVEDHQTFARLHHGDQLKVQVLAAYGFGLEQAEHAALIGRVMADAKKGR